MKELKEYRAKLIEKLREAAEAFRAACLAIDDPFAPVEENGWNVHQIAVHTRDVDKLVYGWRIRRTAVEDNPEFPNFDGEAYMAENYDASESLSQVLNSLVESVASLVDLLQRLPVEAWSRPSQHTMLGRDLTLQSWVEKNLAHIEEHLATVKASHNK
jgi:hypothetical protein